MTDQPIEGQANESQEKKKISLQDAIKNKLAQKKQEAANDASLPKQPTNGMKMKSQHNKKPNNQRRRTGGS